MITYAAAGDAMIASGYFTPALENALRKAKLRNIELACNQFSVACESVNINTKRINDIILFFVCFIFLFLYFIYF